MDENREAQVEQEEEALDEGLADAFEDSWSEDEGLADDDDEMLDGEEATDAQPEPEAGEDESAETEGDEEEAGEPEEKAEDQRFHLKHNGEETDVSLEEVIELAQKGMDYDRIKEDYGRIKADSATMQRYREQEAFLKELAESGDEKMDIQTLMEVTRARMLMGRDPSLTEDEARRQVRESAKSAGSAEKKEEAKAAEPSPEERRQRMFADFLQAYPDVQADKIPKEVWDDAGRTFDLVGAYQRHENRELRKEIDTLRQNNKNKERSTGSRRSVGSPKQKDDFDEAWDSFS